MGTRTKKQRSVIAVDFGGVIIRTRFPQILRKWERRLDCRFNLTRTIFDHPASAEAIRGVINQRELSRRLTREWSLSQVAFRDLLDEFWRAHTLNQPLLSELSRLRDRFRIVVLSNMWPNWRSVMWKHYGLAPHFDRFYVSADLRIAKPDARIFELVMRHEGIRDPAKVLLIDDLCPNIQSAARTGVSTIEFTDNKTVFRQINRWARSCKAAASK